MSKCSLSLWTAALMFGASAQAAVVIGGTNYADNAGVDQVLAVNGSFTTSGGTLASVLTDKDASTYAYSYSQAASLNLGWSARQALNLDGADIDLYELGKSDTLRVTINGISKTYLSVGTGALAGGYTLNRVSLDLSDFGISSGSGVNSLLIGMDINGGTVPTLSFVGAKNISAIPEASSAALMGLGLAGLIGLRRRR